MPVALSSITYQNAPRCAEDCLYPEFWRPPLAGGGRGSLHHLWIPQICGTAPTFTWALCDPRTYVANTTGGDTLHIGNGGRSHGMLWQDTNKGKDCVFNLGVVHGLYDRLRTGDTLNTITAAHRYGSWCGLTRGFNPQQTNTTTRDAGFVFDGIDSHGLFDDSLGISLGVIHYVRSTTGPASDRRYLSYARSTAANDHIFMLGAVNTNDMRTRFGNTGPNTLTSVGSDNEQIAGKWVTAWATMSGDGVSVNHFMGDTLIENFLPSAGALRTSQSNQPNNVNRLVVGGQMDTSGTQLADKAGNHVIYVSFVYNGEVDPDWMNNVFQKAPWKAFVSKPARLVSYIPAAGPAGNPGKTNPLFGRSPLRGAVA